MLLRKLLIVLLLLLYFTYYSFTLSFCQIFTNFFDSFNKVQLIQVFIELNFFPPVNTSSIGYFSYLVIHNFILYTPIALAISKPKSLIYGIYIYMAFLIVGTIIKSYFILPESISFLLIRVNNALLATPIGGIACFFFFRLLDKKTSI